jgi:hypothetical protein
VAGLKASPGIRGILIPGDQGAAPYHLKVLATEVFPTVLIRVTLDSRQHAPTAAPGAVGYEDVRDLVLDA